MRRRLPLLALVLLVLLPAKPARAGLELLVPAYFYPVPGSPWVQLTADAGQAPITAILNPASGPGPSVDPTYVSTVSAFRAAGGRILGYVPTTYGARAAAAVKADIDTYRAFYAIDGIFLDEVTSDDGAASLDYYADIYAFIKGRNAGYRVIGNPGTNAAEAYLTRPCADALVLYENGTGYDTYAADPWVYHHPRAQVAHLLYAVPDAATMLNRLDQALSRGVGLVFITDDSLVPNPWDTLPPYWSTEVARLAALNQAAVPERPAELPLRVAPNPSRGVVVLTCDTALPAGVRLTLTDVDGRRVWEQRLEGEWPARRGLRLDFGARRAARLAEGFYILTAASDNGRRRVRVILGR